MILLDIRLVTLFSLRIHIIIHLQKLPKRKFIWREKNVFSDYYTQWTSSNVAYEYTLPTNTSWLHEQALLLEVKLDKNMPCGDAFTIDIEILHTNSIKISTNFKTDSFDN